MKEARGPTTTHGLQGERGVSAVESIEHALLHPHKTPLQKPHYEDDATGLHYACLFLSILIQPSDWMLSAGPATLTQGQVVNVIT
jgi:hypothetical protein